MATVIVTTIWWSDLLWKGQHLCFLTCLSPQKELHFWTVHGRVTISAEPVLTFNTRLLLAGPLGAKISPDPAQEESEITGRTAARSSLQSSLRRSLPSLCAFCLPLFLCPPLSQQQSLLLSSPKRRLGSLGGPNLIFSANLQEIFALARDVLPDLLPSSLGSYNLQLRGFLNKKTHFSCI